MGRIRYFMAVIAAKCFWIGISGCASMDEPPLMYGGGLLSDVVDECNQAAVLPHRGVHVATRKKPPSRRKNH